jgi:hypothetical protein
MARGSLIRRPWSSRRLKAVTILSRLMDLLAALGRQRLASVLGVDHLAQLDLLGIEIDAVDET